jgi:Fe2+ transport system protein B
VQEKKMATLGDIEAGEKALAEAEEQRKAAIKSSQNEKAKAIYEAKMAKEREIEEGMKMLEEEKERERKEKGAAIVAKQKAESERRAKEEAEQQAEAAKMEAEVAAQKKATADASAKNFHVSLQLFLSNERRMNELTHLSLDRLLVSICLSLPSLIYKASTITFCCFAVVVHLGE